MIRSSCSELVLVEEPAQDLAGNVNSKWDLGSGPLSGKQTACEAWDLFTVSAAQQLRTQPTDARNPLPASASVGSGTGRPAAFRPWVFLSPPAEPGVPVFEHRALHVPCRWSAGGCRCRGPRGRDGAAAIAVASHLDAGCAAAASSRSGACSAAISPVAATHADRCGRRHPWPPRAESRPVGRGNLDSRREQAFRTIPRWSSCSG